MNGPTVTEGRPGRATTDIQGELYGALMEVVNGDGMLLIGDAIGATVEPHPRESHPAGTADAHFGPVATARPFGGGRPHAMTCEARP